MDSCPETHDGQVVVVYERSNYCSLNEKNHVFLFEKVMARVRKLQLKIFCNNIFWQI